MKISAPQTTWLVVSGLATSICGMPFASATAGNSSNDKAARSGFMMLSGCAAERPARSDEQDDERDHQRIQRHRFGQREPENGKTKNVVAGRRVARHAGDQRREDVADADADAGERDHGDAGADV